MATYDDFQKLDIRVGKIVEVRIFLRRRSRAYKLKIDLGNEIGGEEIYGSTCEELSEGRFEREVGFVCGEFSPPTNWSGGLGSVDTWSS
jgi:tRNA-binding EMAP/Myf-like protein